MLLGYCCQGLNDSRITKVPYSWLYKEEAPKPIIMRSGMYDNLQPGPFTTLKMDMGTWTAAEGEAEAFEYSDGRGKGIHIMGGVDKTLSLELPKPTRLGDIDWLAIERFTSRDPYMLSIEAWQNDRWLLVGGQDGRTRNLTKHAIVFAAPDMVTTRLRFRCTSLLGAILADGFQSKPISLNGFFND